MIDTGFILWLLGLTLISFGVVFAVRAREKAKRAKKVKKVKEWLDGEYCHIERESAARSALVRDSIDNGQWAIRCSQGRLVGIGRPTRHSSVNDAPVYDHYRPADVSGLYSSASNSFCSDSSSSSSSSDSGSSCD